MPNSKKFSLIVILILVVWLGSGLLALRQTWVSPGEFGDMFGAVNALFSGLALLGVVYTVYQQQEALRRETAERKERERRRQIQIVPKPEFGGKRHGDGGDTHLMEVTVSDAEDRMRSLSVVPMWGELDGLNIGKKGQKCLPHQYRIASRVRNDENIQFQLLYEDEDGNRYSKFISWYPLKVGDEPFN